MGRPSRSAFPRARFGKRNKRDRLLGALDLHERTVEEIMLHRSGIEMIDAEAGARGDPVPGFAIAPYPPARLQGRPGEHHRSRPCQGPAARDRPPDRGADAPGSRDSRSRILSPPPAGFFEGGGPLFHPPGETTTHSTTSCASSSSGTRTFRPRRR